MARAYRLIVGQAETGLRLDRFLVSHLPQTLSRSAVQRAIDQGAVHVDGQSAKAHRRLKAGQRVEASLEQLGQPSRGIDLEPQPIPLDIVFEDHQLLVVNKPHGLVVHPAPGHWSGTLVNAVLWHLNQVQGSRFKVQGTGLEPRTSNLERILPRAGIVHRLDKDTSGLLVIAKTELALRLLSRQLKARLMSRRYVALVQGHLPYNEGTIQAAIGRHAKDRKLMAIRHLGGREAVTHYRVIRRLSAKGQEGARCEERGVRCEAEKPSVRSFSSHLSPHTPHLEYTVVDVSLETGRTHQIRVHFAHLGHPVLGDATYSRHAAVYWARLGIERQLLHAYAIRFTHPTTNQAIELRASLPSDMHPWIPEDLRLAYKSA
ncbi:MAG: RluA family pseudouridine synthase [Candidatus Omnitrophica bacterium]|nr:RluA family pseudouridine synthase [Candidatus Omnitrophota bacterium]